MKLKDIYTKFSNNIFIISVVSLLWFLIRSGLKPSRAAYPCQQVAVSQFSLYFFFIYPFTRIKRLKNYFKYHFGLKELSKASFVIVMAVFIVKAGIYSVTKFTEYKNNRIFGEHREHLPVGLESENNFLIDNAFAQIDEHRVVSVHDSDATNWDYSTGYHWEYINQEVVDNMIAQGVMTLTGTTSVIDAWNEIIPYESGDDIAIKFNFNNSFDCQGGDDQEIDGYAETANAVIDGLISIGVPAQNIWIYDAMSRVVPNRFIDRIENQNVRFFGGLGSVCNGNYEITSFVDPDSDDVTGFTCTEGNLPQDVIRPAQVLVDAEHLINIPLFKSHGSYVTLALKNHYGSVTYKLNDRSSMHQYFEGYVEGCNVAVDNVLADINNNPHIRDKTRLIIGEGIFGNPYTNYKSVERWSIFGEDDPNIYFFSVDPVAISSVMTDYIVEERGAQDHWQLHAAALLGLGVHEHWDNFTNKQYSAFEYIEIDLDGPSSPDISVVDSVEPYDDMDIPFGGVNEGDSSEKTLTVNNTGDASLVLSDIAVGDPLAEPFGIMEDDCSGQTITSGGSCTLTISFSPSATGQFDDSFNIPSNDPDESTVTVTVSGTGLEMGTNRPPTSPVLIYPENGQSELGTTVTFVWESSTDPEGDDIEYYFSYCMNEDFTGCGSVSTALIDRNKGTWPGRVVRLFLFGTLFAGFISVKRGRQYVAAVVLSAMIITSCGTVIDQPGSGNGSGEENYTVSGLDPDTLYYWKVIAADERGAVQESEVWDFRTK